MNPSKFDVLELWVSKFIPWVGASLKEIGVDDLDISNITDTLPREVQVYAAYLPKLWEDHEKEIKAGSLSFLLQQLGVDLTGLKIPNHIQCKGVHYITTFLEVLKE